MLMNVHGARARVYVCVCMCDTTGLRHRSWVCSICGPCAFAWPTVISWKGLPLILCVSMRVLHATMCCSAAGSVVVLLYGNLTLVWPTQDGSQNLLVGCAYNSRSRSTHIPHRDGSSSNSCLTVWDK